MQISYQKLLDDLKAVEERDDFRSDPERDEAIASQTTAVVKMILVNLIEQSKPRW